MTAYRHLGLIIPPLLWLAGVVATWPLFAADSAPAPRDAMTHFFDQSFNNLKEEAEIAKTEGKRGLFIMFSDEDCPWCAKMKATVMNQVAVQDYYHKHFRLLHLDIRGDAPVTDFAGQELMQKDYAFKVHRVRATPVFLFVDTAGKVLHRHTGVTASPEEFLWLGEFIVNGEYKTKNFTVYKRERRATAGPR